jgi:hypothetical protein
MSVVKGSLLDRGQGERTAYPFAQPPAVQQQQQPQQQQPQQQQQQQPQQQQQQQQQPAAAVRRQSQSAGGEPPTKRNRPRALTLDINGGSSLHGQLGLLVEAALNSPSDTLPGTTVTIRNGRQCRVPTLLRQTAHIRAALFTALSQQSRKEDADAHETIEHNAAHLRRPAPERPEGVIRAPAATSVDVRQQRTGKSAFRNGGGLRRMRSFSTDFRMGGGASAPGNPLARSMSVPIPSPTIGSPFLIPAASLASFYPGSPLAQHVAAMSADHTGAQPSSSSSSSKLAVVLPASDVDDGVLSPSALSSAASAALAMSFPSNGFLGGVSSSAGSPLVPASGAAGASAAARGGPLSASAFPSFSPGFLDAHMFFPQSSQASGAFAGQRFSIGAPLGESSAGGGVPLQRSSSGPAATSRAQEDMDSSSDSAKPSSSSRRRNSMDSQWPDDWLEMPCVQFNRLMKTCSLSAEQISELKKARRRKKNRTYAKRSRDKKNAK